MSKDSEYQFMRQRDSHVGFGSRQLVVETSDEIEWIRENYEPNLFQIEGTLLCYTTPQNMIGSLLVEREKPALLALYQHHQWPLPERLRQPVEILTDVPLHWSDQYKGTTAPITDYLHQPVRASRILYKRACGARSAVVLDPPLAGLILSDYDSDQRTFAVDKLWGDYLLQRPDGTLMKYYKHEFIEHDTPANLSQLVLSYLLERYAQLAADYPLASELFAHLFQEVYHQAVDLHTFQRTISAAATRDEAPEE